MSQFPKPTTPGELAFEAYLKSQGINFEFESLPDGKTRPPDFTLNHGRDYFLDVKDFEPKNDPVGPGPRFFDPYKRIRKKIAKATEKFREYDGESCVLVLYNKGDPLVDIWSDYTVLGAMYGDAALRIPFNVQTGTANDEKAEPTFHGPGKMIQPGWKQPVNTRISALISLRFVQTGRARYLRLASVDPSVRQIGAYLDFDPQEQHVGVIVWENCFAQIPFPRDLFCGEYDEIYGVVDDRQPRVFAGRGILAYQEDMAEADAGYRLRVANSSDQKT